MRQKTVSEIHLDLEGLADRNIRVVLETLKNVRGISKELLMIERGRKINAAIESAIEDLEEIRDYLEDYSITTNQEGPSVAGYVLGGLA